MKKLVLFAAAAMYAVFGGNSATAAPFETLGGPVGGGSNVGSSLGLTLSVLGLVTIPIAPAALIGTADAEVILDGSGNGTATIFSTNVVLGNIIGSANTVLGTVNYDLQGVTVDISMTANVVGGVFTIDSSTVGTLGLVDGNIILTGSLLFVGVLNENVDLSTDPISLSFADLGASTLPGTADNTLGGVDTTTPGDEITIAWNGAGTSLNLDGIPITVTLTGAGLSIGATPSVIPEPTSGLFLASLAAGVGAVVRRRRA